MISNFKSKASLLILSCRLGVSRLCNAMFLYVRVSVDDGNANYGLSAGVYFIWRRTNSLPTSIMERVTKTVTRKNTSKWARMQIVLPLSMREINCSSEPP